MTATPFETLAKHPPEVAFPFYGVSEGWNDAKNWPRSGHMFRLGDNIYVSTVTFYRDGKVVQRNRADQPEHLRAEHTVRYVCHIEELPVGFMEDRKFVLRDESGRVCRTQDRLEKRVKDLLLRREPLGYVKISTYRDMPSGSVGLGPDNLFTGHMLVDVGIPVQDVPALISRKGWRWLTFGLDHKHPNGNHPFEHRFEAGPRGA